MGRSGNLDDLHEKLSRANIRHRSRVVGRSPARLDLGSAPDCNPGEVRVVGRLGGIDQGLSTPFTAGFTTSASVTPIVVDVAIGSTGHLHIEQSQRELFCCFVGTYISPIDGSHHKVGYDDSGPLKPMVDYTARGAKVFMRVIDPDCGQADAACPPRRSDDAVALCFDEGTPSANR